MLTTTQNRYVQICAEMVASGATNEALAQRFGVARTCVDRAIRWGREHDLFALDTTDKLRRHLLELRAALEKLERAYMALDRRYRRAFREKKDVGARGSIRVMALLSERMLGYRTRIMELEGIYKHVLNIQHGGGITVRTEPDLSRLDDGQLDQLEQLTRRTIASNN